ncbi:MAG: DUF2953 domain-containing protein [Ruthenibacterium sp.]
MHVFLSVLGWLLLALLGLLILLLILPVFLLLEYKGDASWNAAPLKEAKAGRACENALLQAETSPKRHAENPAGEKRQGEPCADASITVKLRVLFFTFTLLPIKEKPDKPQEQPPQAAPVPQAEKPKKKAKSITLETILGIVSTAGAAMRIVMRGLWFTGIRIVWPVQGDTPADTAIAYGKTQAYFGGVVAALRNFLNLRFQKVNLIADFNGEYTDKTYFYCKIGATPAIMVVAGIAALVRLKRENIL